MKVRSNFTSNNERLPKAPMVIFDVKVSFSFVSTLKIASLKVIFVATSCKITTSFSLAFSDRMKSKFQNHLKVILQKLGYYLWLIIENHQFLLHQNQKG